MSQKSSSPAPTNAKVAAAATPAATPPKAMPSGAMLQPPADHTTGTGSPQKVTTQYQLNAINNQIRTTLQQQGLTPQQIQTAIDTNMKQNMPGLFKKYFPEQFAASQNATDWAKKTYGTSNVTVALNELHNSMPGAQSAYFDVKRYLPGTVYTANAPVQTLMAYKPFGGLKYYGNYRMPFSNQRTMSAYVPQI